MIFIRFEAYENVKANSTAYQGKVSQLAQVIISFI